MRTKGQHLTRSDHDMIERFYNLNLYSTRQIAELLGCHWNTINNELRRGFYEHLNSDYSITIKYSADKAQSDYDYQATAKGREIKLGCNRGLAQELEQLIIDDKYSPYAALETIKRRHNIPQPFCVRTLYNYIEHGYFNLLRVSHLPESGKRRKPQKKKKTSKKLPHFKSIEFRPKEILSRDEFGHWEMDTLQGKRDGQNETVLVLTERKSRYELLCKLPNKTAAAVPDALIYFNGNCDLSHLLHTVTVDNGVEFSDYQSIENSLGCQLFYCHPYSSSERGSNENQNKMLRRWLPKGESMCDIDNEELQRIQRWLNNYPRKLFGGRSAAEEFSRSLSACP